MLFEGIPRRELTPSVQRALERVMSAFGSAREALEQAHEHERYLTIELDRHPFLPVLNRHALLREVGIVLQHLETTGTSAGLACLHIVNWAEIRRRAGLAAGDAALGAVARELLRDLRASDRVGCFGDADFGVLLVASAEHGAFGKASELAWRLRALQTDETGTAMTLEVDMGFHALVPGETPEEAMAVVDRALRSGDDVG